MRIVPDGESRRVEMMANFRTKDTEKPDVTITLGTRLLRVQTHKSSYVTSPLSWPENEKQDERAAI